MALIQVFDCSNLCALWVPEILTGAHETVGCEGNLPRIVTGMISGSTIFNPNTDGSLWNGTTQYPQGGSNSVVCCH
jgi:hypothetical protein